MTTVRPTIEKDFPAIAELTNVFIRNTAVHFAYEPVTAEELAGQWREAVAGGRYPWFSAECDGKFAGYAKAGVWRARTAYSWTTEVGIYIVEEFRGRGVGKVLYGRLIDELRSRGFHSVIGGMTMPNDASARLHDAMGFKFIGAFPQVGYKMGKWHDVGFWQLMLWDEKHEPKA